jgi:hypothetical protein
MKSLEDFERETAEKRARLLKDLELAKSLPVPVCEWIGEGGFEPDGNTRKPDEAKRMEIRPYIIHAPFRGAEHVAYKLPSYGEAGEYQHSKHRPAFRDAFMGALLDAYAPSLIEVVALKGTYASMEHTRWDWKARARRLRRACGRIAGGVLQPAPRAAFLR